MQQHRAPRFELTLVHERRDVHVILRPDRRRHDPVRVIDDLLQRPHAHRRPPHLVNLALLVLVPLLPRLQPLLIPHELLLHQQIILHPLQLQHSQLTLRLRRDVRQSRAALDPGLLLLLPHAHRRRGRDVLLLLLLLAPSVSAVRAVGAVGALSLAHRAPSIGAVGRSFVDSRRASARASPLARSRSSPCVDDDLARVDRTAATRASAPGQTVRTRGRSDTRAARPRAQTVRI